MVRKGGRGELSRVQHQPVKLMGKVNWLPKTAPFIHRSWFRGDLTEPLAGLGTRSICRAESRPG